MMRIADIKKVRPLRPSVETLGHQFLQRCAVSGTAKGKAKVKTGQTLKRSKITVKRGQTVPDPSTKGSSGPRKSDIEQTIDSCLNATAPVRSLMPKEKQREAEREKMGLISEARKKEIANFKKSKKIAEEEDKPGIIGTEGLDLITLGLVDADKIPRYKLTVEDGMKLAKEYSRVLMRKHRARQAAETAFLKCKKEAIAALPEGLRDAALVPDLTPFPVNRYMATLTPPIEGYIDKINEAAKKQSQGKQKLR